MLDVDLLQFKAPEATSFDSFFVIDGKLYIKHREFHSMKQSFSFYLAIFQTVALLFVNILAALFSFIRRINIRQ